MEIQVKNLQKKVPIRIRLINRIARKVLLKQKVSSGTLSLVFVTSQKIRTLNKKYHRRDYVTDVLAFDLSEEPQIKGKHSVNAEIIIAPSVALKNAAIYGTPPDRELILYVIHGILHLTGYNDHSVQDRARIRRREQELLSKLGL